MSSANLAMYDRFVCLVASVCVRLVIILVSISPFGQQVLVYILQRTLLVNPCASRVVHQATYLTHPLIHSLLQFYFAQLGIAVHVYPISMPYERNMLMCHS